MKKAFTLLELVFVIVVIGILTAVMLPRLETNPLQEAATQLLSDIRYTQHLALIDDKFDANNSIWYRERWQLIFSNGAETDNQWAYSIFSDNAGYAHAGNVDLEEVANSPLSKGRVLSGGYAGGVNALDVNHADFKGIKKLNLGLSYSVDNVLFSASCNGTNGNAKRISFDHFGRPIQGDISGNAEAYEADNLIQTACVITLVHNDENISISIEPETGYSKINF
ncbi:pilus assembly FimT family protein [Sulfurimonas sp.]